MAITTPDRLDEAMDLFTVCVETPCVPGEMEAWLATLKEAAARLGPHLSKKIDATHKAEYAEIIDQDSEMQRTVAQLKDGDQEVLRQFHDLANQLDSLASRVKDVEPHEAALQEEVDRLIKKGLAFVLRVRQQEIAVRTWLQEAFNRDRGVAD